MNINPKLAYCATAIVMAILAGLFFLTYENKVTGTDLMTVIGIVILIPTTIFGIHTGVSAGAQAANNATNANANANANAKSTNPAAK